MRTVTLAVLLLLPFTVTADDPKPPELTPEEQKLAAEATKLDGEAWQLYRQGKPAAADEKWQQALAIRQKLYPAAKYPAGHPDLANSLNLMGFARQAMGQSEKAARFFQQAFDMRRKLYPDAKYPNGHPDLAISLNNLGFVRQAMGQAEKAAGFFQQALDMNRRLYPAAKYPDGHPDLALGLNSMGLVLQAMGKSEKAAGFFRQALDMKRKLYSATTYPDGHPDLALGLNNLGSVLDAMGQSEKAAGFCQQALEMNRKLYPAAIYADGHPDLAGSLNGMGFVLQAIGQSEKAAGFFQQAVDMYRKLYPPAKYPDGHPALAASLNYLALVLQSMGQSEKAAGSFQQALDMRRKLYPPAKYPDGHPDLAQSLNNLGFVLKAMGRSEKAAEYYEEGLEMRRKLYPLAKYPDGHPDLANSLNNLGGVRQAMGQPEKAAGLHQQTLDMLRKLYAAAKYPDGHPFLAASLSNMGHALNAMGQPEKATGFYQQALDMDRKLFPAAKYPDGHSNLAQSLSNLGRVLDAIGQPEKAIDLLRQAVRMQRNLVRRESVSASESAAFELLATLRGGTSHLYYSAAVQLPLIEADSYQTLWDQKGTVQRLLSRRHLAATAARHQSPDVRRAFEQLGYTQRELGRLYANPGKDLAERDKRMTELSDERDRLTRLLAQALPAVQRDDELDALTPTDLLAALPDHAVLIDFVRYNHHEKGKPVAPRYLAFILAKGRPIRRILLEQAAEIDAAVSRWRIAIQARTGDAAAEELRQFVWTKLSPHLPARTKTLFISPDGDLARLPWAALPIAKDRVLLEDFTLAMVPHGRFLLEQLKDPPHYTMPESIFALGNVAYGPGSWPALPATAAELTSLQHRADGRNFVSVSGQGASAVKVNESLPAARYAHFATHGFFDAEALTEERKREALAAKNRALADDSRTKVATKNPLGFVGLVLANGEVLNGLALVDLPLENLRLVTLSACETGLGELTGGEGVQGLQRAFHLAGCPNVVASLWKVNDAATAALMAKFYHELWVNQKAPLAALREAQLTIYHHPELIPDLTGERGAPKFKDAVAVKASDPAKPQAARADTKLWAAFVLSGVGK